MSEEKYAPLQQRRHAFIGGQQSSSASASGGNASLSSLAPLEARLAGQTAVAAAQLAEAQRMGAAQMNGASAAAGMLPTLPTSSSSAPLRPASASLAHNLSGAGAAQAASDLHALEWANTQFQLAGVQAMPSMSGRDTRQHVHSALPIQHLGMQQRMRHAHLFGVVERLREGQQHMFLEQLNQFPNVDRPAGGGDDYARIWHAFRAKDEEAEHLVATLNDTCQHIDALNRHAAHTHA